MNSSSLLRTFSIAFIGAGIFALLSTFIYFSVFHSQSRVITRNRPAMVTQENAISAKLSVLMGSLQKSPEDPALLTEIGSIFFEQQEWDKAFRFLHQSYSLDPQEKTTVSLLAYTYFMLNNYDQAAKLFEEYLKMDDDPAIIFNLATIYKNYLNEPAKTQVLLEQLATRNDLNPEVVKRVEELLSGS